MAARSNSVASRSADIQQRASQIAGQVAAEQGWLETQLKPKKITARYPIKGKALLFATCGFGSLGDALFGYNSGTLLLFIIPNQVSNTHSLRHHVWSTSQPSLRPALLQRLWWRRWQHRRCQSFDNGYLRCLPASISCCRCPYCRTPRRHSRP